jgi:hypothetical protein
MTIPASVQKKIDRNSREKRRHCRSVVSAAIDDDAICSKTSPQNWK